MKTIKMTANYYQQFDADYSLEVPGEGYGGWKKADIDINTERTAVVVMHAWNCGTYEMYPGWYRVAEWIPRAQNICAEVFPKLLNTIRGSNMKLFHVVLKGEYYKNHSGYKKAVELTNLHLGPELTDSRQDPGEITMPDAVMDQLYHFRMQKSFYGIHNKADVERGFKNLDFAKEAKPAGDEEIAEDTAQLLSLCREYRINHLIYTGFTVNGCLMDSPGGIIDMTRKGLMCSVIRQAVTAIENKETAGRELNKDSALWRIALGYGFVFELDDFIEAVAKGD